MMYGFNFPKNYINFQLISLRSYMSLQGVLFLQGLYTVCSVWFLSLCATCAIKLHYNFPYFPAHLTFISAQQSQLFNSGNPSGRERQRGIGRRRERDKASSGRDNVRARGLLQGPARPFKLINSFTHTHTHTLSVGVCPSVCVWFCLCQSRPVVLHAAQRRLHALPLS